MQIKQTYKSQSSFFYIFLNQGLKTMVLKIGPDRPVTVPVRSNQLDWKAIEPKSDHLNRRFDQRTRRTGQFLQQFIFLPPSPCDWYPHYCLERCPTGNSTSIVAWSIILSPAPSATSPLAKSHHSPTLGDTLEKLPLSPSQGLEVWNLPSILPPIPTTIGSLEPPKELSILVF